MWVLIVLATGAALVVARRCGPRISRHVRRCGRRGALVTVAALLGLQALIGAPAFAQPFDCTEPPMPERPGAGMVGALDPAPLGVGKAGTAYAMYGYAGQVWYTYDLGCGPQSMTHPNAVVDTWVGNQLFNVAKVLVGATNGLHYALLSGDLLAPLDQLIGTATIALYDSVFAPWFGLVAIILAVVLFRYIWLGDLATIGKRTMWALAALWFASATYLTPLVYTHALDGLIIKGTSAVQGGFLHEVGVDERDALPTLLHQQVVYRTWLRGEFGSPDSPKAQQLGMDLLAAQAYSKKEVLSGQAAGSAQEKKEAFERVAGKMGSAYGYFTGAQGSRIGAGMLGLLQGLAYTSFQLLAKAAILLAQVLLRVLILLGPLIGLVALLHHGVLRAIGRVAGAALLNVIIISAMAGVHTLLLTAIFDPSNGFSLLIQLLLAGLLTLVFLMVGKPVRRMGQMIELSVGAAGGAMPRVPPSILRRGRRGGSDSRGPQDEFWEHVRTSDPEDEVAGSGRRNGSVRPETEAPSVMATAQRADRHSAGWHSADRHSAGSADEYHGDQQASQQAALTSGAAGAPDHAGNRAQPQRPGGTRAQVALPEARSTSRAVDTSPIAEKSWGVHEDPVMVPSTSHGHATPEQFDTSQSSRRDTEVVAGRPVDVVYRPSRGLEVADGR